MKHIFALLALLGLFAPACAFAQIGYSDTNNTYSQNFDSLGTNASAGWTNNTSLAGWYALAASNAFNPPTTITRQTGASTTGAFGNFSSTTTNANRSLGWVFANSVGPAGSFASIGFGISNTTGLTLDAFNLSYVGREWRGYSNAAILSFQYKIGGTFDNNSTNSLNGNTAWTAFTSLNFTMPTTNANLAVDGLVAPNFTSISNSVTGLTWANGDVLWMRWRQENLAGTDGQMAIDDVSFSASAVPEPSTYAMLALAAAGLGAHVMRRRRR